MAFHLNWEQTYNTIGTIGPKLLQGIDEDTQALIEELAGTTDLFWSDGLQDLLSDVKTKAELREAMCRTLTQWKENIIQVLMDDFAINLDPAAVVIDHTSPQFERLIEASMMDTQTG